jgi:hypothetical protein
MGHGLFSSLNYCTLLESTEFAGYYVVSVAGESVAILLVDVQAVGVYSFSSLSLLFQVFAFILTTLNEVGKN